MLVVFLYSEYSFLMFGAQLVLSLHCPCFYSLCVWDCEEIFLIEKFG